MEPRPRSYKKHRAVLIIGVGAVVVLAAIIFYKYGFGLNNQTIVENSIQKNSLEVVAEGGSGTTTPLANPLQNNIDNELATSTIADDSSNPAYDDQTTTAKVSQDFFARYVQLEQNTTDPTASQQQDLVNNVLADNNINLTPHVFTQADLTIDANETAASIKIYGAAVGQALIDNSPAGLDNELVILENALESNEASSLLPLNTHIDIYKTLLATFISMPVPASAAGLHLAMVNDISELYTAAQAMDGLFSDPLPALAGVGLYDTASSNLISTFSSFKNYFASKNVVYAKNTAGYTFTHLVQ